MPGRPTVLASTQGSFPHRLPSPRCNPGIAFLQRCCCLSPKGNVTYERSCVYETARISTFSTKDRNAPWAAEETLPHQFYREGKQCMGMAGAELETVLVVFKSPTQHTARQAHRLEKVQGRLCSTHESNVWLDCTAVQASRRVNCCTAPEPVILFSDYKALH